MTIDIGTLGAKAANDDGLLQAMRDILRDGHYDSPRAAVMAWVVHIMQDETLTLDAVMYAGHNIYRRCRPAHSSSTTKVEKDALTLKAKSIIESGIRLWVWNVPGLGKQLSECTFDELPETAPLIGRFLAKLAQQGAPGVKVRDVFKNERELQAFWRACQ